MSGFKKATRSQVYLKLAITGPTGSGKTYSALRLATGLLEGTGKRIAGIDTENESMSLYSEQFDFDVLPISPPFDHEKFSDAVLLALKEDYGAVIIDSSSHFWEGILEYKARLDSRPGSNSYTNWNEAGKKFSTIITAVLQSKIHVICCMRSKMDYVMETNERGKQQPKKVGLAPMMRDGIEYEFTSVFDVALNHECICTKDRTSMFTDKIFQITEGTGTQIRDWLATATPKTQAVDPQKTLCTVSFIDQKEFGPADNRKTAYIAKLSDGREVGTLEKDAAEVLEMARIGKTEYYIHTQPGSREGSLELFEILDAELKSVHRKES